MLRHRGEWSQTNVELSYIYTKFVCESIRYNRMNGQDLYVIVSVCVSICGGGVGNYGYIGLGL